MRPKSLSATALNVAGLCISRYHAEHIVYARGPQNTAASLGTSVHGALEIFVKACYLDKTQEPSLQLLLDLFKMSYMTVFATGETDTQDYLDGVDMLKRWYARTDFSTFTVISCEVKKSIPIPTPIGDIPFNYIWDRFDDLGDGVFRVNDYKTNRAGVRPEQLRKKLQVRAYALAAAIEHKDAKQIWVELDMLRHDGPVGVSFSRDDNAATWRFLKAEAKRIIETDDTKHLPETLNPECNYCVRKTSCSALLKNISVGGVASIGGAQEAVDIRAQLEFQKKAIASAIDAIDEIILTQARNDDQTFWETASNTLSITVSNKRGVDAERVEKVIGDTLFRKYGGMSITLANVDKLLKGDELTDEQKKAVKAMIRIQTGEPRVSISTKAAVDDA